MICIQLNSVLLITPNEVCSQDQAEQGADASWMRIETQTVGDALRQVRYLRPNVLVFDLTDQQTQAEDMHRMLRVMSAVRMRIPSTSIVVLGTGQDVKLEQDVRRHGAAVYLPVSPQGGRAEVSQIIQSLYARPGPASAHGPPHSGVPPR